jgi:hypothetical protein
MGDYPTASLAGEYGWNARHQPPRPTLRIGQAVTYLNQRARVEALPTPSTALIRVWSASGRAYPQRVWRILLKPDPERT